MKKFSRTSKNILALCLCLALLAGTACAEEVHIICSGKSDYLNYDGTLPDGRVLLVGINVTKNEHVAIGIAIVLVAALLVSLAACFALSVFLARRFALPLARIVSRHSWL